jgi:4-hydroxybenzoate polyprenyltransferase
MTTTKPFPARIWTYSLEMFPVLIYIPYIIALYVCLSFTAQAISGTSVVIDRYSIIGLVSAFFMMLLMRTFDDLKDFEIDKELFPERATPRGAVFKSDIQILSVSSFIILLIVNIWFAREIFLVFAIMMTYALLTFNWFFAEKIHRKNVFLTMVTHQPLPFMVTFYLIFTALASGPILEKFTWNHLVLLFIFALPVTAWETSRKIRSAEKETTYVTFSKIFGARGATFIPLVCLVITHGLALYLGQYLNFGLTYFITMMLLLIYMLFFYVRFIIMPTNENNVLKNTAMIFTSLLFLNLLVHTLLVCKVIIEL